MQVARLVEPLRFEIQNDPEPQPREGEVLIQSLSVGVCASDVHYYAEGGIGENRLTEPLIPGHEPMGTVVGVGPIVSEDWIGRRVAIEPGVPCFNCEFCLRGDVNLCPDVRFFGTPPIDGAFREKFTHPAVMLEEVPDDFSPGDGAMLEPLGVAIHSVDLVRPKTGTSAVVVGCGTIGLSTIIMLRAAGVAPIYAVDPLEYRTNLALKNGADHVFNGTAADELDGFLEATKGRGADAVFEAAGKGPAQPPSMEMAAVGGKVVVIGISAEDQVMYRESFARRKGLTIYMARRSRFTLRRGIELIQSGRIDLSDLVTHRFPLARIQEAFEIVRGYRDDVVKAVIEPCTH